MTPALTAALADLPTKLAAHVTLSAAALGLAIVIAAPLVLLARTRRAVRWAALAAAGLVQTIPALALLALFYPALLAVRGVTGGTLPVLGFLPALLALTLYALLPLLRGGLNGLMGVDRDIVEAADGVGMTPRQRLVQVELPLAAPVIMAGVRTAAVWTIGAATLATAVGAPCLGDFIFSGLQTENWVAVLVGCGAAAGLAVVVDALLGLVEAGLGAGSRARMLAGVAGLTLIGALAVLPQLGAAAPVKAVVVGAKNFSDISSLPSSPIVSRRARSSSAAASARRSRSARSPRAISTPMSIMPGRCGPASSAMARSSPVPRCSRNWPANSMRNTASSSSARSASRMPMSSPFAATSPPGSTSCRSPISPAPRRG
jgi:ABC-type proline/glycine betaine transport system permease subunit